MKSRAGKSGTLRGVIVTLGLAFVLANTALFTRPWIKLCLFFVLNFNLMPKRAPSKHK